MPEISGYKWQDLKDARLIFHFKNFIILTLIFILCSCSFNKIFFKPDKYPRNLGEIKIKMPDDTITIFFSKQIHQPTFTKRNGKDTVQLNYTIESVLFRKANGDTLNGWFLKPKNQQAKITILHLHGNGGSLLRQYKAISPLIKNGFQILLFDYSGYGFSHGKPTPKNVLADANSALDYLKSREDVKDTKIIIYGQSLGGHLSAVVAAQRQNDIDGLVMEGAFSSPKDIAARMVPVIGRIFVRQRYSAKKSIKNYHKPLLLIHSTEDKVIPIYMSQIIFKSANSPKEFYEIRKCHICGPTYYPDEISAKIKEMLN